MAKKKPVQYERGLTSALSALREQFGHKPLFRIPTRRIIPMRHRSLGALISGVDTPGLPTGCYIEVLGESHSGKTSLTFAMIDTVINQPPGSHAIETEVGLERIPVPRRVLFIDFEQTLDIQYLQHAVSGVVFPIFDKQGKLKNPNEANVFVHRPETLEEGGDIMLRLIASGEFGLVVLDSIASMLSDSERGKTMAENTVGETARALGKFFRKSAYRVNQTGVVVVLVNQYRDKIGVSFGDPRTTPGGKAARYYVSATLETMGGSKTPYFTGTNSKIVKVKCKKNKITGRKDETTYHLGNNLGLSVEVELTEALLAVGMLEQKRGGRILLQTKTQSKDFVSMADWLDWLHKRPKMMDKLWTMVEARGFSSASRIVSGKASGGWGLEV